MSIKKKKVKFQGQKVSTNRKILSQGILMWNIKALALNIQILLTKLKISKSSSNSKVKVTRSKILVSIERSCLLKYSCEIRKL